MAQQQGIRLSGGAGTESDEGASRGNAWHLSSPAGFATLTEHRFCDARQGRACGKRQRRGLRWPLPLLTCSPALSPDSVDNR